MFMVTMTVVALVVFHGSSCSWFHLSLQPFVLGVVVAPVFFAASMCDGAASKRSAIWLTGCPDSDASAIYGMETDKGKVEKFFIHSHMALWIALQVSKVASRYAEWQLVCVSAMSTMSTTMSTMSTMSAVSAVSAVPLMSTMATGRTFIMMMFMVIMVVVIMIVVMIVAMFVIVFSLTLHNAVSMAVTFMVVFIAMIVIVMITVMSGAFSNMVIWWWQVELPSGIGTCVGGVAVRVPANLEMVLMTMVCCVISGLIKTADVEVRGNRPLTHQILFHVDSSRQLFARSRDDFACSKRLLSFSPHCSIGHSISVKHVISLHMHVHNSVSTFAAYAESLRVPVWPMDHDMSLSLVPVFAVAGAVVRV